MRSPSLSVEYKVDFLENEQLKITEVEENVQEASEGKIYTKISNNTDFPELSKVPYIGMSREELERSFWGTPKKINKTTTVHGVREQWVYDRYGDRAYVYVSNGIVTAIQE